MVKLKALMLQIIYLYHHQATLMQNRQINCILSVYLTFTGMDLEADYCICLLVLTELFISSAMRSTLAPLKIFSRKHWYICFIRYRVGNSNPQSAKKQESTIHRLICFFWADFCKNPFQNLGGLPTLVFIGVL